MQSVQRHFGKYMKRSADEKQVSVLLKDFEDADQLLTRVSQPNSAVPLETPVAGVRPDSRSKSKYNSETDYRRF